MRNCVGEVENHCFRTIHSVHQEVNCSQDAGSFEGESISLEDRKWPLSWALEDGNKAERKEQG